MPIFMVGLSAKINKILSLGAKLVGLFSWNKITGAILTIQFSKI